MTSVHLSSQVRLGVAAVKVVTQHSPLSDLVVRAAVTIRRDATLGEAAEAMRIADVSALLVEHGAGILTERDLGRAFGAGVSAEELVSGFATPHPLVVPASMGVVEACGLMLNEQVRHLIVEFHDGWLGVVSLRDAAAVLLQAADPHLWLASLRVAVEAPAEILGPGGAHHGP